MYTIVPIATSSLTPKKIEGDSNMKSKYMDRCIRRSPSQCRPCMVAVVGATYHAGVQYEKMARGVSTNS